MAANFHANMMQALLTLDRLTIPDHPESRRARQLTIALFVPLIALTLMSLAVAMRAVRENRLLRYRLPETEEQGSLARDSPEGYGQVVAGARGAAAVGGTNKGGWSAVAGRSDRSLVSWWRGFLSLERLTGILIGLKAMYVVFSIALYSVTNADGWCLNFVLYTSALHATGNGLTARDNNIFDFCVFMLVVGVQFATSSNLQVRGRVKLSMKDRENGY